MTTSSKAGAQRKSAARRNTDPRDERDPATMSEAESPRETRPLPSLSAPEERQPEERQPEERQQEASQPEASQPEASQPEASEDETATVLQQSVRPEVSSRPRKNTLATAITRPARDDAQHAAATPPYGSESMPSATPPPPSAAAVQPADEVEAEIADEVDEPDEWAIADQPTVYLSPRSRASSRPAYLDTGEEQVWPPRPARAEPPAERPQHVPSPTPPPLSTDERRLATPTGRVLPRTPPGGVPRAGLSNPRMRRLQELRGRRMASDGHERLHQEPRPVAEVVRKWWGDLLPGLEGALHYQREAKASGVHPIPAHAPTPTSRLGDAFGRLAASARDLTGRAQAAATPALKRLHSQAEQAAQALVEKIEGSTAQQQLPLLGPGRIAIFFKQGVTVGQAQKLLSASQARPIRLIPRKHGFLSLVPPGMEAEVAERLRVHPYVRDVAYLTYDEYGQPVLPPQR